MEGDREREIEARRWMRDESLTLDSCQRKIVERTIAEHCERRSWHLHAVYCGQQHVHVVVTASDRNPRVVMDQLKAWCSRRLKEQALLNPESMHQGIKTTSPHAKRGLREKWWTEGGSKRQLFQEASLEAAIRYVSEGQDVPYRE